MNFFLSRHKKICICSLHTKQKKNNESNVEMMAKVFRTEIKKKQAKKIKEYNSKTVHTKYNISYHKSIIMRQNTTLIL